MYKYPRSAGAPAHHPGLLKGYSAVVVFCSFSGLLFYFSVSLSIWADMFLAREIAFPGEFKIRAIYMERSVS